MVFLLHFLLGAEQQGAGRIASQAKYGISGAGDGQEHVDGAATEHAGAIRLGAGHEKGRRKSETETGAKKI